MLTFVLIVGPALFILSKLATWLARRDYIERRGIESYREIMWIRGIDAQNLPPFWKFCLTREKRTPRGSK